MNKLITLGCAALAVAASPAMAEDRAGDVQVKPKLNSCGGTKVAQIA